MSKTCRSGCPLPSPSARVGACMHLHFTWCEPHDYSLQWARSWTINAGWPHPSIHPPVQCELKPRLHLQGLELHPSTTAYLLFSRVKLYSTHRDAWLYHMFVQSTFNGTCCICMHGADMRSDAIQRWMNEPCIILCMYFGPVQGEGEGGARTGCACHGRQAGATKILP